LCSAPCPQPCRQRGSANRQPATPSAIHSPRTFWSRAPTSRTIQELLGHSDGKPTMVYTHVLNRGPAGVRSPADLPRGKEGSSVDQVTIHEVGGHAWDAILKRIYICGGCYN
jgi:hypothetical protein